MAFDVPGSNHFAPVCVSEHVLTAARAKDATVGGKFTRQVGETFVWPFAVCMYFHPVCHERNGYLDPAE